MADQQDANSQNSGADSSTATQNDNGDNGANSSAGTQNTVNVPFHEDPQIQEYIQRQVDKRVGEKLQNTQIQHNNIPNQEDELVNEFSKDLGLDKNQAKLLVEKFRKVHDTMNGDTRLAIQEMNYRNRIMEMSKQYPDILDASFQREMIKTFSEMSPKDKELALKSDRGIKLLYHETKERKGHYANSGFRNAGGSSKSSASNMNKTDDSSSTLVQQAALAASSGDRKAYEETVRKLYQNGGFKK